MVYIINNFDHDSGGDQGKSGADKDFGTKNASAKGFSPDAFYGWLILIT